MSRYLVGIDLGTTNIAVAYVDTAREGRRRAEAAHVPRPAGRRRRAGREQPLLPSFLYLPGPHDLAAGVDRPAVEEGRRRRRRRVRPQPRGEGARAGRCRRAKSWLCHPGVDRTAPLLPWAAPPDVPRLSPLEVSARSTCGTSSRRGTTPRTASPRTSSKSRRSCVTVPASFDDVARNLTAEAAKQAGLKHVTLLEEPQAAFYAWLGTHSPQEAGEAQARHALPRRRRRRRHQRLQPDPGRRGEGRTRRSSATRSATTCCSAATTWTSRWRRPSRRSCPAGGSTRRSSGRWCRRAGRRRRRCSPTPPPPSVPGHGDGHAAGRWSAARCR